jgi:hypothetical protein
MSYVQKCQHDPMLDGCTVRVYDAGTCVELYCLVCTRCTKELIRPAQEMPK